MLPQQIYSGFVVGQEAKQRSRQSVEAALGRSLPAARSGWAAGSCGMSQHLEKSKQPMLKLIHRSNLPVINACHEAKFSWWLRQERSAEVSLLISRGFGHSVFLPVSVGVINEGSLKCWLSEVKESPLVSWLKGGSMQDHSHHILSAGLCPASFGVF